MADDPHRRRSAILSASALVVVAACALWIWRSGSAPAPAPSAPPPAAPERAEPDVAARTVPAPPAPAPALPDAPAPAPSRAPDPDVIAEMRGPWAAVDLEEVEAALPDNLYWEMAAPTRDPDVQAERERIREQWNREYGKVLSNTASEEEIHAYYARRRRLSSDYIEVATYLLDHYRDTIPERDVGLLELAIRLHHARLEENPRKIAEALERKREADAARAAWRAQQEAFAEDVPGTAP